MKISQEEIKNIALLSRLEIKDLEAAEKALSNILTYVEELEELDLTVRSFNCLKKAGIEEVSQLASLSLNELLKIKNLGKKSLDEILEKMKDLGYDLEKNGSPE